MVEDLDASIGKIVAALRSGGQLEDTLVFFGSDNGGERYSCNWPLSGGKGQVLEGGIRVPTLLGWPGRLGRRRVDRAPVVTMDWTATFLELAGAGPDPGHPLDGVSLVDHLLGGKPAPARDLFWRMKGQRALRRGLLEVRPARRRGRSSARPRGGRARAGGRREEAAQRAHGAPRRLEAIDAGLLPYPAS